MTAVDDVKRAKGRTDLSETEKLWVALEAIAAAVDAAPREGAKLAESDLNFRMRSAG